MIIWNPWHGCHKVSEGCQHCYMYFLDGKRGIDTSKVYRTENVSKASGEHKARFNAIPSAGNFAESNFNLPVQRRNDGRFKLPSGMQLYVGLSTDFFVEEADEWREEAWRIIRQRSGTPYRHA